MALHKRKPEEEATRLTDDEISGEEHVAVVMAVVMAAVVVEGKTRTRTRV